MRTSLNSVRLFGALLLTLTLVSAGFANVWMDETFDGSSAFVQAPAAGATLDTYSANPLLSTVTASPLTATGTVVSTKSFNGANSYRLNAGEGLSVGAVYQDQTNGNFQLFQFAVNVDPIPAAGTVGTFRWNFDMDSATGPPIDHSYFVRLVSTGSVVNLVAGEDVAGLLPAGTIIGTLASNTEFKFVTLLFEKDLAGDTNSNPHVAAAAASFSQGMHFFVSSNTEALAIPVSGGQPPAFKSMDWAFSGITSTIFIDNLYWDGGMEDDAGNHNERSFSTGALYATSEPQWELFN